MALENVGTINVVALLPELDEALIDLLESLDDADWRRPAVGNWSVRDLAAHLLDGNLRRLSFQRDHQPLPEPAEPITGYRSLVHHLDRLNAEWVTAFARLSPRVLIDLLRWSGPQVGELFGQLDPNGEAFFSVGWAGQSSSPNWFDLAREYTEKWHHQQQIRDSTDRPGMCQRQWLLPVIDTFLRALPHRYRDTSAAEGTRIAFTVTATDVAANGEAGDGWTLVRQEAAWRLWRGVDPAEGVGAIEGGHGIQTRLTLTADTAWRFMSKGLTPEEATKRTKIEGNLDLARPFFDTLAVMA